MDEMTLIHMAALEDVNQHQHCLLAHIQDDWEKMFDHIPLELQIYAIRDRGCPNEGYSEWLAEDQQNNTVHIITLAGTLKAKYQIGIKQGQGISCPCASCTSGIQARAWLAPIPLIAPMPHNPHHVYQMAVRDPQDTVPATSLFILSYSDDNHRYTAAPNLPTLTTLCQTYVNHAGDLSLVTKMG